MHFAQSLAARRTMLAEGAVYERLRRHPDVAFHPAMRHGVLIYDPTGKGILADIHRGYIAAAATSGHPAVILSDTWRANGENIARSTFAGRPVNQDNVVHMQRLAAESGHTVFVGGLMGCRGDAYRPQEALSESDALIFHRPQAAALAEAQPDFLVASTLPALSEALGMARALGETGHPYLISFVLRAQGTLLDGTPWADAIAALDGLAHPPLGHAVNCVHPSVLSAAMNALHATAPHLCERIVLFQANTSACTPEELACAHELLTEEPEPLARQIADAHKRFAIPIVGGCCGTDERHIAALGKALNGG